MNIYVGNISRTLTEEALRQAFEQFGEVASVKIMLDRLTKEPRGFGFVTMPNDTEAEAAMNNLNGHELGGQRLRVNEARPQEERTENRSFDRRPSQGGSRFGGNRSSNGGGPRSGSNSSYGNNWRSGR